MSYENLGLPPGGPDPAQASIIRGEAGMQGCGERHGSMTAIPHAPQPNKAFAAEPNQPSVLCTTSRRVAQDSHVQRRYRQVEAQDGQVHLTALPRRSTGRAASSSAAAAGEHKHRHETRDTSQGLVKIPSAAELSFPC